MVGTGISNYQHQKLWSNQYLPSLHTFDVTNVVKLLLISKLPIRTSAGEKKRQKTMAKVINTIPITYFYKPSAYLFKL